ncbi:hypothetical protein MNB_SV-4-1115 [hydrothermal vent metagenome]|uniref:Uncharacterized protein n=1 Tax=hydrothermal vent metagenome TaxID=652676 RepID=A0A1W1E8T8_9ZZZZ
MQHKEENKTTLLDSHAALEAQTKKEWHTPSLSTLKITMTLGGSGDPEDFGGSGPLSS